MNFNNKKFLVLGAGISGIAVANILQKLGGKVILNDVRARLQIKQDLASVENSGVELIFGRQDSSLLQELDYLVLSPGVSIELPLVQSAQAQGIVVMSEIEVAYRLCVAPIVAITGTNGKTTTTTLVGEMLKAAGRNVVVGGNIGAALSQEVEAVSPDGVVVAEISSFQLEGIIDFRPKVAAILNLTPDHLDRHHSMQIYQQTKENIFKNQTSADYLVLNYDDANIRTIAERAAARIMYFSRKAELQQGVFIKNNNFVIAWNGSLQEICSVDELKIKGSHNIENALAACSAAFLAGAQASALAQAITEFQGVEHRIELVRQIGAVAYYNDSKATNPESSIKALEAFDGNIILIAGGRDKLTGLNEFTGLMKEKVAELILLGEAQERFAEAAALAGLQRIHRVASMAEAVELAHSLARPGQTVLLSPACASYDMFASYEERGRIYKNLVRKLG